VTFSDNDNIAIDKRFYQVCYFSGATWLANNNNGFLNDNFNNGISPQWTTYSGTWNNSSGALIQTDEVSSNTNIYAPVSQTVGNIYLYHWQMKIEGSGTNRRAGIYIMVDSPTAIQRNNAYMIYFRVDQNTCQIYKSVNDVIDLKTDDSCPVDLGIWFDAKVIFNTTTGEINVFKDNVLVSSWIDTTPLTAGTHISFRTGEAIVSYDNMKVYRSRSTSEFVSIGTNGDIPYQNVSPSQPASVILSVVTDTANNISNIDSAYINIDWTQPTPSSYVADGTSNDIDTTFDATQLSANWDAAIDNNSGIASYYYCIGSSPGTDDIVSWTNNSNILSTTEGSLLLNYNSTYFVSVTAMNNAGLFSDTLISDGIIVLSPTSIPLYENNDDSFAIYPVPAKDIIIVSSLLQEEITDKPQIYSISGKLIPVKISRIDSKTFEINLQSVSSGIFFLKLKTKSGYRTKVFSVVP
ncbi:MAG TPA: T9SS type A sorting domain-containing protein, partial [Bacteroidales bacterium]|nr:T9SS type A sorting domain-containing protein [Bacteroidales bacterium]